ncbi:phospholipid carrier-dependent glycosyltransferase [Sphingomonas sp. RS2018]
MSTLIRRPALLALLIALAAQLLFSVNVARPSKPVFDEVHYVPAARTLIARERPVNIEHPLLGKTLIGWGIQAIGDRPLGWRAMSTLAGTATVLGVFAILLLLFGSARTAGYGALFAMLNITLYVHARIAMLEPFLGAFVTLGVAALLWSMRSAPRDVLWRWMLGAALLGFATAVKWTAAPYIAFAAIAFLANCHRRPDLWPGLSPRNAILSLGGVSILAYFLTFAPAFAYAEEPLTLARLLPFQWEMYERQTQVLAPHPYQSDWWTWPLMIRPIWYLYEPVDGAVRGILYVGNPAVMWGGLVAVIWLADRWWSTRDRKAGSIALLWIASLAMWAAIPKSLGFYYYYHLSGIWLAIAIAAAFHIRAKGRRDDAIFLFTCAVIGLFAYFYPIISAAALPDAQGFNRWMWFGSWR